MIKIMIMSASRRSSNAGSSVSRQRHCRTSQHECEFGFDYLRPNMVNDVDLLKWIEFCDTTRSTRFRLTKLVRLSLLPAAENPDNYYTFAKIAAKIGSGKITVPDEAPKCCWLMRVLKKSEIAGNKNCTRQITCAVFITWIKLCEHRRCTSATRITL